jgi:hypothetical protein
MDKSKQYNNIVFCNVILTKEGGRQFTENRNKLAVCSRQKLIKD